jgi:hypothetical protein
LAIGNRYFHTAIKGYSIYRLPFHKINNPTAGGIASLIQINREGRKQGAVRRPKNRGEYRQVAGSFCGS